MGDVFRYDQLQYAGVPGARRVRFEPILLPANGTDARRFDREIVKLQFIG